MSTRKYFAFACPTIHDNGEKCGGLLYREGSGPGSEVLEFFPSRELAQLAATEAYDAHEEHPDIVEVMVVRV